MGGARSTSEGEQTNIVFMRGNLKNRDHGED